MKKIGIACFTTKGSALAEQIQHLLEEEYEILRYHRQLKEWTGMCFEQAEAIIYIGACGIAVRSIAPYLKSKTSDPAVIVLDEKGQFAISLLSGHIGGANELAEKLADKLGAIPVITTASDVNGTIAIDVFAKKNQLKIDSMISAKKIASAILKGERVGFYCEGEVTGIIPDELILLANHKESDSNWNAGTDHLIWVSEKLPDPRVLSYYQEKKGTVLHLIPRCIYMGVGCRKDKPFEEIKEIIDEVMEQLNLSWDSIVRMASIDLKKEEKGLLQLAQTASLEFLTYSAEELQEVSGEFQASEFVKRTTGVDNVCERSALRSSEPGGILIQRKYARNGVTAAFAKRKWRVHFGK